MNIFKTLIYLTTFFGIVGYLETGNLIYGILIAIGIIGIIKINLNK